MNQKNGNGDGFIGEDPTGEDPFSTVYGEVSSDENNKDDLDDSILDNNENPYPNPKVLEVDTLQGVKIVNEGTKEEHQKNDLNETDNKKNGLFGNFSGLTKGIADKIASVTQETINATKSIVENTEKQIYGNESENENVDELSKIKIDFDFLSNEVSELKNNIKSLLEEIKNIKSQDSKSIYDNINLDTMSRKMVNLMLSTDPENKATLDLFTSIVTKSIKVYFDDFVNEYIQTLNTELAKIQDNYAKKVNNLNQDIENKSKKVLDLENENNHLVADISFNKETLNTIKDQVVNERNTLNNVEIACAEKEQEYRELSKKVHELKEDVDKIVSAYKDNQARLMIENLKAHASQLGIDISQLSGLI